jgi:CubicO group peptidase (beta-lactamase class C family)
VTRYIPELRRVHDPYGKIDDITIRMLMNHTAGFQGPTWPYDKGLPWEPFEPTEWSQLVAMMPYEQLLFSPGEKFGYSNPAYVYLGRIIEQLTGDPWDGYVYKNIFLPLGLDHSYFRLTPRHLRADRSHNYAVSAEGMVDKGPDFDPGITTPNGGWNAPLSDFVRYVAFLTGKPANDVVLKRSSLEEMWQPGKPMSETDPNLTMGLSFFVIKRGNATILGHTGGQAWFRAFFYFNPATSAAVIATFNTTNEQMARDSYNQLRNLVYDFLAGQKQ